MRLDDHGATCPRCARHTHDIETVWALLDRGVEVSPPPHVTARVLGRVRRGARVRACLWGALAAAAAVGLSGLRADLGAAGATAVTACAAVWTCGFAVAFAFVFERGATAGRLALAAAGLGLLVAGLCPLPVAVEHCRSWLVPGGPAGQFYAVAGALHALAFGGAAVAAARPATRLGRLAVAATTVGLVAPAVVLQSAAVGVAAPMMWAAGAALGAAAPALAGGTYACSS